MVGIKTYRSEKLDVFEDNGCFLPLHELKEADPSRVTLVLIWKDLYRVRVARKIPYGWRIGGCYLNREGRRRSIFSIP